MHADRRELILHRRAIGGCIAVGEAQHAAVFGMQDIELHAIGQIDVRGKQAKAMGLIAARGLDVSDAAGHKLAFFQVIALKSVRHVKPPVLISISRRLGWTCLRVKSIFSNPFSNAADETSMPSARTKLRKNCRAAMPR